MQLQVYVNGHEWLARQLTRHRIRYTKQDNVFLWLEDFARAQRFADRFASLGWVALLDRDAHRVTPVLRDVLAPMQDSWVTTQSEYATDLVFTSPQALQELVPRPPSSAIASSPCRATRGLSTPWPRWTTPRPACGASTPFSGRPARRKVLRTSRGKGFWK